MEGGKREEFDATTTNIFVILFELESLSFEFVIPVTKWQGLIVSWWSFNLTSRHLIFSKKGD